MNEHEAEVTKPARWQLTEGIGLTASHRCERCGAQAYVEVELPTKSILLFCAHHYREHKDALMKRAHRIIDYTDLLVEEAGQPTPTT